jgi:hypothetical protein
METDLDLGAFLEFGPEPVEVPSVSNIKTTSAAMERAVALFKLMESVEKDVKSSQMSVHKCRTFQREVSGHLHAFDRKGFPHDAQREFNEWFLTLLSRITPGTLDQYISLKATTPKKRKIIL